VKLTEVVRVPLPTPYGGFEISAFESPGGGLHVALVYGEIGDGDDVLTRVHSECLTGDALGSLRCDCGIQLHQAMRTIAAEQRGVLVYAIGHEGRGIGLVNKLRAYVAQDLGADTVDANLQAGLPVDARDYTLATEVLAAMGVRSIRLLTNNAGKAAALRAAGVTIDSVVSLRTAAHNRNAGYLRTKAQRMDHDGLLAPTLVTPQPPQEVVDAIAVLGRVRPSADRPYVVLKYAQSLDGRIATASGDARWISGEPERCLSHALRAACDAVMVGVGTVLLDDPQLTVRMVPGASPQRVILDSTLRLPMDAHVLDDGAATTVVTTARSDPARRAALREMGVHVEVAADDGGRVDLRDALARLRAGGIETLLVEGGASVITSLLAAQLVDRLVVATAPIVIGAGTEAVGGLGTAKVQDAIAIVDPTVHVLGADVVVSGDIRSDGM
jgi:GTP cyclohydrolase II